MSDIVNALNRLERAGSESSRCTIDQDADDGSLFCTNLMFYTRDQHEVFVASRYNSKQNYPLEFVNAPGCSGDVFDEQGNPTTDFMAFLEGK